MEKLKDLFKVKADKLALEIKDILKEHGQKKIGEVQLAQIYQGMRGITGMVYETSLLDAKEGIRFRGFSIPELQSKLPKAPGGTEPLPEGLFYLLLTGEVPTESDVRELSQDLRSRAKMPAHVFKTIDALPVESHPMTQFVTGVMAMQTQSEFARHYATGMSKKDYWLYTYEDAMNLIARLPELAAYVYRRKYKGSKTIAPGNLDWAGNFAHMLGFEGEGFKELMRLYMTIHADHEGGNVSAHTTHLVGSALSDPYLSYAAGMNGLAGPLHGLANQEVIKWIFEMQKSIGTDTPSKEQIATYVQKTLTEGKVVPGYGHAVLRKTDPRFTAQQEFAKKHMPGDPLVNTVWRIFETVPPILTSLGKIKNPWPNVDAHSGALLVHYDLKEYEYYTVLFAVSRALGVLAAQIWSRGLSFPLERPKSVTTANVKAWLQGEDQIWGRVASEPYSDERFGLDPQSIEARISRSSVARPTQRREPGQDQELWIGLPVQSLLTPYDEICEILATLNPLPGQKLVDLGAGYGRIGFVIGSEYPGVEFVGYEYVAERVEESLRCLSKQNFPNVRMIHADLSAADFTPVPADLYFMYDFGNRDAIEKILHDLREIAKTRAIAVVGRGRSSRDAIELRQPWLSQVIQPLHTKNYSVYRSA